MIFFGAETGNDALLRQMDKGGRQSGAQIKAFAARLRRFDIIPEYSFVLGMPADSPAEVRAQIERAYVLTLCREPTDEESNNLAQFLEADAKQQRAEAEQGGAAIDGAEAYRRALVQMCRVILNLNEFVYPD